ncbi:hypothetical protein ACO0QE_000596 [Hanseniaspora vineae]
MTDDRKVNVVETIGGSSVRKYLNENVTKELLQGVRKVALERPDNPLLFLGQYLIERSKSLGSVLEDDSNVEKQETDTAAVKSESVGPANERGTDLNNFQQKITTPVDIKEEDSTKETNIEMKEESTD